MRRNFPDATRIPPTVPTVPGPATGARAGKKAFQMRFGIVRWCNVAASITKRSVNPTNASR
ncbi:MAG: hypothetical protein P8105_05305 [Dehalococcoidia bacterium]